MLRPTGKTCSMVVDTPLGLLRLTATERGLASAEFVLDTWTEPVSKDPILTRASRWVQSHFAGTALPLKIAFDEHGTVFQREVWSALRTIPYGQCVSYSEVAKKIGRPNSVRAVANAIGRNPCLIFTPCHRVIRSDGSIGGFSAGIDLKHKLLELEARGNTNG